MFFPDLLCLGLVQPPKLLRLGPERLLKLLDSRHLIQVNQVPDPTSSSSSGTAR